jgi:antirestriction protein ArdC
MARSLLTNDKVRAEIEGLLKMFDAPESLETMAKSMFHRGVDIPSDNWSVLNRLIMMNHNTMDARGAKSWFRINRKVNKGGNFCIIAPRLIQVDETGSNGEPVIDKKTGKQKKRPVLVGFYPIPVWGVENTEGKDVDYKMDKKMPEFLCEKVAKAWDIDIKQGFDNPSFYGYFSPDRKEIVMATDSQVTFFHELCHCGDEKVQGKLKPGQESTQEIVAEFGAAVLMRMFGLKYGTKNTYDYVKKYAEQQGRDAIDAVIPLVSRIGKVINLILEENERLQ